MANGRPLNAGDAIGQGLQDISQMIIPYHQMMQNQKRQSMVDEFNRDIQLQELKNQTARIKFNEKSLAFEKDKFEKNLAVDQSNPRYLMGQQIKAIMEAGETSPEDIIRLINEAELGGKASYATGQQRQQNVEVKREDAHEKLKRDIISEAGKNLKDFTSKTEGSFDKKVTSGEKAYAESYEGMKKGGTPYRDSEGYKTLMDEKGTKLADDTTSVANMSIADMMSLPPEDIPGMKKKLAKVFGGNQRVIDMFSEVAGSPEKKGETPPATPDLNKPTPEQLKVMKEWDYPGTLQEMLEELNEQLEAGEISEKQHKDWYAKLNLSMAESYYKELRSKGEKDE